MKGNELVQLIWITIRDTIDGYFITVNTCLGSLRMTIIHGQQKGNNAIESSLDHTQYLGVTLCWWGIYAITRIGQIPKPPIAPENQHDIPNDAPPGNGDDDHPVDNP